MHVQPQAAVKQSAHGLLTQVAHCRRRALTGLGIGLCFGEKALDFVALLVVGFALSDVNFPVLPVAVVRHRPIEVNAVDGFQCRIFPIPAIEMHKGTRAADDASTRRNLAHQNAIGTDRRRHFAVGVEGDDGANVGLESADLSVVTRRAHGTDLLQSERRVRRNESGVDVAAVRFDNAVVTGSVNCAGEAHVVDFTVAESDGGVFQRVPRSEVGRTAQDQDAFLLFRSRCGLGNGCRSHKHAQSEGQ